MRVYRENKLDQVRPGNTFESFTPRHPSQEVVRDLLSTLATQVTENAEHILQNKHPFERACLLFLHGQPGRGKTHLVESFINRILATVPGLRNRMVLSRGQFLYDYLTDDCPYGDAPIVVIDDMYHDKMRVSDLHPNTDVRSFMKLITDLYDNHRLVIVTSNFPLLNGGIMAKVKEVDTIGRVVSRAKEVMSLAGEYELLGDDYREEIARQGRRPVVRLRALPEK